MIEEGPDNWPHVRGGFLATLSENLPAGYRRLPDGSVLYLRLDVIV